jgi:hypothetical protein
MGSVTEFNVDVHDFNEFFSDFLSVGGSNTHSIHPVDRAAFLSIGAVLRNSEHYKSIWGKLADEIANAKASERLSFCLDSYAMHPRSLDSLRGISVCFRIDSMH